MKKLVILDFDGTLANSFDIVVDIFKSWSTRYVRVSDVEIERLRGMDARAVMKELHIPFWRAPWLLAKGRREMTRRLPEIELFSGLTKVLEALREEHIELAIVSSNSERNIRLFLKTHHIEQYFSVIKGGTGLFGKTSTLRRIGKKFPKAKVRYYVGDETRDVESARRADFVPISVTWGYNNHEVLNVVNPDNLANNPEELLKKLLEK